MPNFRHVTNKITSQQSQSNLEKLVKVVAIGRLRFGGSGVQGGRGEHEAGFVAVGRALPVDLLVLGLTLQTVLADS